MTEPFKEDFVTKIIGEDKIERFCTTEYYQSHLKYFEDNEQLSEEVHTLINNQYYDRACWPIIQQQMHLLSKNDTTAVKIFNLSSKIANIYMLGGWHWYFSDVNSRRDRTRFSSDSLLQVKNSESKINSKYDDAYLSYFTYDDDGLWVEHNEPLNELDVSIVEKVLSQTNDNEIV